MKHLLIVLFSLAQSLHSQWVQATGQGGDRVYAFAVSPASGGTERMDL